jgi:hypothetical protein
MIFFWYPILYDINESFTTIWWGAQPSLFSNNNPCVDQGKYEDDNMTIMTRLDESKSIIYPHDIHVYLSRQELFTFAKAWPFPFGTRNCINPHQVYDSFCGLLHPLSPASHLYHLVSLMNPLRGVCKLLRWTRRISMLISHQALSASPWKPQES